MLISFQSKASADVVMFDGVATSLLKLMGREVQIPSAMYPEDVPGALSKLRMAVADMPDESDNTAAAAEVGTDPEAFVSLKVRAHPLIELLESAVLEGSHVMWDFA